MSEYDIYQACISVHPYCYAFQILYKYGLGLSSIWKNMARLRHIILTEAEILVILHNHFIEIGFFQQVLFKYTNITLTSNMFNKKLCSAV